MTRLLSIRKNNFTRRYDGRVSEQRPITFWNVYTYGTRLAEVFVRGNAYTEFWQREEGSGHPECKGTTYAARLAFLHTTRDNPEWYR